MQKYTFLSFASFMVVALMCSRAVFAVPSVTNDVGLTLSAKTIEKISQEIVNSPEFKNVLPIHNYETQKPTLKLDSAPQLVKDYGRNLFNLNFDDKFNLHLKLFDPTVSYQMKVKDVSFTPQRDGSTSLSISLGISDLKLGLKKFWLRELGFSKGEPLSLNQGQSQIACHPSPSKSAFFKDHIFAAFQGIHLSPRNSENSEITLNASVRAVIKNKKLDLSVDEIQTNLATDAKSLYRLQIEKIILPEVDFLVNGKCFAADLTPINDYLRSQIPTIKDKLLKAVGDIIVKDGTAALQKALQNLTVPTEFAFEDQPSSHKPAPTTFTIEALPEPATDNNPFNQRYYQAQVDNTRAHIGQMLPGTYTVQPSIFEKWYYSFTSVELSARLNQLTTLDTNHLYMGLVDDLQVNQSKEKSLSSGVVSHESAALAAKHESSVTVSRKWIEEKLSLILMLKLIEDEIPVEGISFENKGLILHPETDGSLSITAQLKVDLNQMKGTWVSLGALIEKTFGNTAAILHLPLLINLKPVLDSKSHELKLSIARNFEQTRFKEESNLKDSAYLIHKIVNWKLNGLADQLEAKSFSLPIDDIEKATSLKPESFSFDSKANLLIGLSNASIEDRILKLLEKRKK